MATPLIPPPLNNLIRAALQGDTSAQSHLGDIFSSGAYYSLTAPTFWGNRSQNVNSSSHLIKGDLSWP
jgi:hypothetical protein